MVFLLIMASGSIIESLKNIIQKNLTFILGLNILVIIRLIMVVAGLFIILIELFLMITI